MAGQGVFAVDRGVFDHPIFATEPFTEREAWLWMLSAAAWKDSRVRVGRAMVDLKRGQLAFALRFLAVKFQWTDSRVRRFLKRLESDAMVIVSATHNATQVTICNYDKYAFGRRTDEIQIDALTDDHPTHQRRKEEEINNSRSKNPEANASGAVAPVDHRKRLFDEGLPKLARMTGKGPDACRSFVGKCLKAASDDAIVVLGLIEDAERNRVADPSAWIVARLKPATGPPARPLTEFQKGRHELKGILNDLDNYASGSGQGSEADTRLLPGNSGGRPAEIHRGIGGDVIDLPKAGYRSSG